MRRLLPYLSIATALFMLVAALSACDNVDPVIAGTPTPSASPTPLPDAFSAQITAEPQPTDDLGNLILSDGHYFQYLSFGDIRVYEYDDGTFLDGVCVNAYPLPLDGRVAVVYYAADGKLCGIGELHTADGGTILSPGTNNVYAEISTDIDVRMMDFSLEVRTYFQPADTDEQAG